MNRHLILGTGARSLIQHTAAPVQSSRSLSSRTKTHDRDDSGNASPIAKWLATFNDNVEMVPSNILKFKHDPSTKGNSRSTQKLICHAPIDKLRSCVPSDILQRVQASSRYYKRGTDAIMVTSDKAASISSKQRDCIEQLHNVLREKAIEIVAELRRRPPKQLSKPPPGTLSTSEASRRFHEQKRLLRKAKSNERLAREFARAREEKEKARGTSH